MEEIILKLLGRKDYVPADVPNLLPALSQPPGEERKLKKSLRCLERAGRIARIVGDRFVLPRESDLIPGRIQITAQGRGFLVPDVPGQPEIAIPAARTATALHGDQVLIRCDEQPRETGSGKKDSLTGTVVRVLERHRTRIVGSLQRNRGALHVVPDDPRIPHDISVRPPRDGGRPLRAGDKVVVELQSWDSPRTKPQGIVTEVLGAPDAEGVDMLAVLRQYGLPLNFPPEVLKEVRQFGNRVAERDLAGRIDCRDHPVITIDPTDAKDFDDAFSLERSGSRRWVLRIHIADVSHYVKPGSALDCEARKRANSTYLVDRVIPMLPEVLSNELCSLKPHIDRLTKCVEFTLTDDGRVLRSRCYPAVIHSQRRFSYEEAMAQMEGDHDGPLDRMLQEADRLAQCLRRRRFENGSLELEFPDTKIHLTARGRVERIERVEYDRSHQLIEEFMLLANEAVAGRLLKLKRPSLHRVHEKPDPIRLRDYREVVLSHNVPCGNLEKPSEVQKLLQRLHQLAIGPALKIGFLKSLMRARYAETPLGHYGLAKAKYAHFTSPIRRYADLIVHRSLFEGPHQLNTCLKEVANHTSTMERNSADAERDSKNVKLYAFLKAQLASKQPQRYSALVTDIRDFGLFVEVADLGLSGLVPLSLLTDDFYEFDSTRVQVHGRRRGRTIRLGDQLEVEVSKVDSARRRVDFVMAPSPGREHDPKQSRRPSRNGRGKRKPAGEKTSSRRTGSANPNAERRQDSPSKKKRQPSRRRRQRTPAAQNG